MLRALPFPALVLASLFGWATVAQAWRCHGGIRLQKTWELYWQNGAELSCSHDAWVQDRLVLGVSAVSTRIGSAWASDALRQEEYLVHSQWRFRSGKRWEPFVGMALGWFWLHIENPLFQGIPHSSPLWVWEGGTSWEFRHGVGLQFGLGWHMLTGDGTQGPGSLYPLFMQTQLRWRFWP